MLPLLSRYARNRTGRDRSQRCRRSDASHLHRVRPGLTRVTVEHHGWEALTEEQLAQDRALPGGYSSGAYSQGWATILACLDRAVAGSTTASAARSGDYLGDRFGRRRIFAAGIAVFTAASAACALAPSSGLLVAARAVQGAGAALVMPLSLTLLAAAFPAGRRAAVVGIWGGIAGLGVAGGPLVGGAVTQGLNWHWIFWINVPLGIAAATLARLKLADSRGPATSIDLPGVALISGGATALVWGLTRAGDLG
jgi:MFS family permease